MTEQLLTLARHIVRSGRYPAQHKITSRFRDEFDQRKSIETLNEEATVASIYVTMLRGAECKLEPLHALYNIVWYNERPCLYGDVAWGLITANPSYAGSEFIVSGDEYSNDWEVTCIMRRNTLVGTRETKSSFSWGDVKRAGLHSLNHYKAYPERMLFIRARTWAMRDLFADVLSGLSIAEEQQDIELLRDIKPDPIQMAENNAAANMDEFTAAALKEKGDVENPKLDTLSPGAKIDTMTESKSTMSTIIDEQTKDGDPEIPDLNINQILQEAEKKHTTMLGSAD